MIATNITELIWNNEIGGLLRLCGAEEREIGRLASDYERFRSVCRAVPLLWGHPFPTAMASFLKDRFDVDLPLSPQNCDAIWRMAAEKLMFHPAEIGEGLCWNGVRAEPFQLPPLVLKEKVALFYGNSLTLTDADSWQTWQAQMRDTLNDFWKRFQGDVLFDLSKDACKCSPTLYHVERALRCDRDPALLCAQTFRFLSEACQRQGKTIYLYAEDGEESVTFLKQIERSVGLPKLIRVTRSGELCKEFLRFGAEIHPYPMRYATELGATNEKLLSLATCYPLGRLLILKREPVTDAVCEIMLYAYT